MPRRFHHLPRRWFTARDAFASDSNRTYVRSPRGGVKTIGFLDTDATLPASARNTGYHLGDLELWFGRDAHRSAYLVEGERAERWPRLAEEIGCA